MGIEKLSDFFIRRKICFLFWEDLGLFPKKGIGL